MDEICYAFVEMMEATQARDAARDAYTSYSWGYHGQLYEDNVRKAMDRFKEGFKSAVREAIEEIQKESK